MSISINGDGIISGVSTLTNPSEITVGTGASVFSPGTNELALGTNSAERLRITSGGKVFLPGTQTDSDEAGRLDIYHTADDGINNPHIRLWGPANQDARIEFGSPTNTGEGGYIMYNDSDEGLYIGSRMGGYGEVNLCTGMNDGSPTSNIRLRITSDGRVGVATDPGQFTAHVPRFGVNGGTLASTQSVVHSIAENGNDTNVYFYFASGQYSASRDTEFYVRGDGFVAADGTFSGGGADYAEYFEWSDGNTSAEDRRGISVVLDGDKIREAIAEEDPIGVISGYPSVIGDGDTLQWKQKYLRDSFGGYIKEDYEAEDEEGNTVIKQRPILNPDYNPDLEYVSREDRPEWDCVGLMGKLRIRKGQVTGARWIKMRDISDSVEEWLVR